MLTVILIKSMLKLILTVIMGVVHTDDDSDEVHVQMRFMITVIMLKFMFI